MNLNKISDNLINTGEDRKKETKEQIGDIYRNQI